MKLIIFDWDGVLADTIEVVHNGIKQLCLEFGKTYPHKTPMDLRLNYKEPYPLMFKDFGFDWDKDWKKIAESYKEYYKNVKIQLFPGAKELLNKLSKKHKLALASSSRSEAVIPQLERIGIKDYFSTIQLFDHPGIKPKPDPHILNLCLEELKIPKTQAIYIGDQGTDILTAKNAGIKSLAVTFGYGFRHQLEKEDPDFIACNINEISAILRDFSEEK